MVVLTALMARMRSFVATILVSQKEKGLHLLLALVHFLLTMQELNLSF